MNRSFDEPPFGIVRVPDDLVARACVHLHALPYRHVTARPLNGARWDRRRVEQVSAAFLCRGGMLANGFDNLRDPILQPLENIDFGVDMTSGEEALNEARHADSDETGALP
ncbi:MAG: hypothetical protein H0V68_02595 [Actinobacteria bacterium]|nr:hypothetical protein [Actinomycetota bacterium]